MENFLIKKKLHLDVMYFEWQQLYFLRLWGKLFVSKGWVQAEITVQTL